MSLGKNSLLAAYPRKGKRKVDQQRTRVVTFIGGSGGIRDPARKRLIRWRNTRSSEKETDGIRDSTINCVNEYIATGVDKLFSESETYSETVRITRDSVHYQRQGGLLETVRITRGSGRTFLCAARDLFGVVVRR